MTLKSAPQPWRSCSACKSRPMQVRTSKSLSRFCQRTRQASATSTRSRCKPRPKKKLMRPKYSFHRSLNSNESSKRRLKRLRSSWKSSRASGRVQVNQLPKKRVSMSMATSMTLRRLAMGTPSSYRRARGTRVVLGLLSSL